MFTMRLQPLNVMRKMNYLKPEKNLRNGFKDPKRLAAIQDCPCCICYLTKQKQTTKTDAHHFHGGGMGKKVSDLRTMAICQNHHTKGPNAFHHIGRVSFEGKFGYSQDDLIEVTNKLLEYID